MITGFNTDVEHEGVVYHVQTEDKGLTSPLILSLVYVKGTILASKRTPYDDLLASGFEEKKLAERLQRQHKLICAAILAGRIEDLKRQTEREAASRAKQAEPEALKPEAPIQGVTKAPAPVAPEVVAASEVPAAPEEAPVAGDDTFASREETPPEPPPQEDIFERGSLADYMPPAVFPPPPAPPAAEEQTRAQDAAPEQVAPQFQHVEYSQVVDFDYAATPVEELELYLIDERRFVAGEFVKIQVQVRHITHLFQKVQDASVTLKVLGSSFRPLIFTAKTAADGTATFYAMLPYFTSGRAAILINVTHAGLKAELRRVIHQA